MTDLSKKYHIYRDKDTIGAYLAGLWEGDGHIMISKSNTSRPSLHITFNIKDLPLAKKLLTFLVNNCCPNTKVGSIQYRLKENACVLNVRSIEGLLLFIKLINGKLRTPKAYQINLIIDWLNSTHNAHIIKRPISDTPVWSNAWLAGFIDADGSFFVGVYEKQDKGQTKTRNKQISCKFGIEQRTTYPKINLSYKHIFSLIAQFLLVKLHIRKHKNTINEYYTVAISSAKSKQVIRTYLDKYPLLSSKYLDYQDWCAVDDLIIKKQHNTKEAEKAINLLKLSMNSNRTKFSWSHLDDYL